MIRTRLIVAFALLSALALVQGVFAWWSATTASIDAERKVIASSMRAEYEALGGNKQRLKVWFAEAMLTGNAPELTRITLVNKMEHSLRQLQALAARDSVVRQTPSPELPVIATLERNIQTMSKAVREAIPLIHSGDQAQRWRTVLESFDRLSQNDMREVIRTAITRQTTRSELESARLAASLERLRLANALIAAAAVLCGAFAVWYFVTHLHRPFARLSALATRLANGELDARAVLSGRDEFAQLGGLLDSMAERLQHAQKNDIDVQRSLEDLVATRTRSVSQAYESMLRVEAQRRQFFAEVSHELRTPVTVIRGEADIALRSSDDSAGLKASLQRISEAAKDLSLRVQDLLDAARKGAHGYSFALKPIDIAILVRGAVSQMQALARYRSVRLLLSEPLPSAQVSADSERLQQALTTVLDNALRYTPEHGLVQVELTLAPDWACIRVSDSGPGMQPDELEQALSAQFRGAHGLAVNPQGCGLGLSIAERILQAHQGAVELVNQAPNGLLVQLILPLINSESSSAESI